MLCISGENFKGLVWGWLHSRWARCLGAARCKYGEGRGERRSARTPRCPARTRGRGIGSREPTAAGIWTMGALAPSCTDMDSYTHLCAAASSSSSIWGAGEEITLLLSGRLVFVLHHPGEDLRECNTLPGWRTQVKICTGEGLADLPCTCTPNVCTENGVCGGGGSGRGQRPFVNRREAGGGRGRGRPIVAINGFPGFPASSDMASESHCCVSAFGRDGIQQYTAEDTDYVRGCGVRRCRWVQTSGC